MDVNRRIAAAAALTLAIGLAAAITLASGHMHGTPISLESFGPSSYGPKNVTPTIAAAPPYTLTVSGWEGPTGEEATFTVTLKAKPGHKINGKYPIKLQLDSAPTGMRIHTPLLKLADAQLEGNTAATFTVVAVADVAGEYRPAGTLRVGVCSDDQCFVDTARISARLTAQ